MQPGGPIHTSSDGRVPARELATNPALRALQRRRASAPRALASLAWRSVVLLVLLVVAELDLVIDRFAAGGVPALFADADRAVATTVTGWLLLAGVAWVLQPGARMLRGRALPVPPARRFRGVPGPYAALAATWWGPALWAVGLQSRSNNDGLASTALLDGAAMLVLVAAPLVAGRGARLDVDPEGVRYRGPRAWLSDGIAQTEVVPRSYEQLVTRLALALIGLAIWLMAFTVAGSLGALGTAAAWTLWHWWWLRGGADVRWPVRLLRLVALDGGRTPALQVGPDRTLELAPLLRHGAGNESLLWTIAARLQATGSDRVATAEEQLRRLIMDGIRDAERPRPGEPVTLLPGSRLSLRRLFASPRSIALGLVVLGVLSWQAAGGDVESLLVVLAVTVLAVAIVAAAMLRAAGLRIEASAAVVEVRSLLRHRRFEPSRVGALLALPVMTSAGPGGVVTNVDGVLVDRDGTLLARLRGGDWTTAQFQQLADAAGVPTLGIEQPLPVVLVDEVLPGYSPSWERDPGRIAVATVVAIVVLAVALVGLGELLAQ